MKETAALATTDVAVGTAAWSARRGRIALVWLEQLRPFRVCCASRFRDRFHSRVLRNCTEREFVAFFCLVFRCRSVECTVRYGGSVQGSVLRVCACCRRGRSTWPNSCSRRARPIQAITTAGTNDGDDLSSHAAPSAAASTLSTLPSNINAAPGDHHRFFEAIRRPAISMSGRQQTLLRVQAATGS